LAGHISLAPAHGPSQFFEEIFSGWIFVGTLMPKRGLPGTSRPDPRKILAKGNVIFFFYKHAG
jgi:hypothetical protein